MKHLFIVGCPRSGTTWAMLLLARHPGSVAAQHVGFFHSLEGLEGWWREHEQQKKKGRWGKSVVVVDDETKAKDAAPDVKISGLMTEEQFYAMCRHTADEVFGGILRHRPDAEVLIEKTPENLRVAEFILKVYPDAHFLHIVRDPRSVYASLKSAVKTFEKSSVFPGNPMEGARFWLENVNAGRHISNLTPNYHEVRYESLLRDGVPELKQIFDWLGLEADEAFCKHTIESASMEKLRKMPGAPESFFRKGEAEGWRDELSEEEIRILEYKLHEAMDALGYEQAYGKGRRPLKVTVEEMLQDNYVRVERFTMRAMRKLGYVIPRKPKKRAPAPSLVPQAVRPPRA